MTTMSALVEQGRWTSARRQAAEETYRDVEWLICHIIWGVIRKYGGDFDELMSDANEAYLLAYETWDGSIPFSNWLCQKVNYHLLSKTRDRCREAARRKVEHNDAVNRIPVWHTNERAGSVESVPDTRSTWRVTELLEELGEDARLVVRLVVETPAELAAVVEGKGGQPRNFRSSIRSHLAEMGWTARRVAESFGEIQRALSE